jgi:tricorn protease
MRRSFWLAALMVLFAAARGNAAPPEGGIVLPRHPAPSPDGREIAFSYQGDIWIVAAEGGEARRVTAHAAYDANPFWSPDGRWIAFSSDRAGNDDIYALPLAGGEVRRLTYNSFPDAPTGWTPDSRAVLFRSVRYVQSGDNPGIFCVPLDGGAPFTVIPVGGHDATLSPDGGKLAFAQGGNPWWRRGNQGNSRHRLWLCELEKALGAADKDSESSGRRGDGRGDNSPDSDSPAPPEDIATSAALHAIGALRHGERYLNVTELGAVTTDPQAQPDAFWATWQEKAADWSRPELETGGNRAPAWFLDGEHLLYASEAGGVTNLKIVSTRTGRRTWVTRFDKGRLRYPALARDGRVAAFEYEDGIYTVRIPSIRGNGDLLGPVPAPQRLTIRIPFDLKADPLEWVKVEANADEMRLSPDGKQIAFVYAGEVFAMKASDEEPFAYNISPSPAREGQIAWAADSKTLLFVSDRNGNADLFTATSADSGEPRLARALRCETRALTSDKRDEWRPRYAPDGKRIAYLRGPGTLMVMDADGSGARELVTGSHELDFSWSPDGKWIAYTQEDDDYNIDVWIVPVDGGTPVNVSRHPDQDLSPCWSPDGKMLAFASRREFLNQTDIWYVWLTREDDERSREERLDRLSGDMPDSTAEGKDEKDEDKDKEKEKETVVVKIDFEDIHKRLHRLTTFPGEESKVLISKDASELVFIANNDAESDLWKIKWDGSEPERLTKGGQNPTFVQWDEKGEKLFFLKKGGRIASVPLDGGETKSYDFAAELQIDRRLERASVFDESWRALDSQFYDGHFHGCDWAAMRERYRPWALGASTYRDFQDVVRMMMGELNASHLGVRGGPGDPNALGSALKAETGELGVIFDASYPGAGARVGHVVKSSPADRVSSRLVKGDIIRAVDGVALEEGDNISRLLTRAVDKRTRLDVEGADGKRREVIIRPIAGTDFRNLTYTEQAEARQQFVERESGGRVAYIHLQWMDEPSLDLYERDLYAVAHGKDALIIDVRDNGGGWTADLMLTSLLAGDHATTIGRDGGPGYPEDRRVLYAWVKPIVVLCDEASFSNAEIFAWAIRTLKRGPVVGQQTAGGVISTGATTLLDGSTLRLPGRGWYSKLDGSNLEGTGCMPDIVVANLPGEVERGIDRQLERALAEALKQIER